MKKALRCLAVLIILCITAQFFNHSLYTEKVTAEGFSDIEISTIEIRYDEDLDESLYLSGKAYTAGACIYGDYLAVPTAFLSLGDERRNMVVVFDMSHGNPVEIARWDMNDLGIPIRDGVEIKKQDVICGVTVTEDYLLVAVRMIAPLSALNNVNYTTGLYVYENPFKGVEIPSKPKRIMTSDPNIEKVGCTVLNSKKLTFDPAKCGGIDMKMLGNKLVTVFEPHNTSDGYMCVTDMSGEYPVTAYISETELLKYTINETEIKAVRVCDVVFEGSRAYVLASTDSSDGENYRKMGIFTVDFTSPENPVVTDLDVFSSDLPATYDLTDSNASLNITDGFAYITTYSDNVGNLKNKRPHLYTFNITQSGFEFIKEFELTNDIYYNAGVGGIGSALVMDDILVGLTGAAFHNHCSYFKFNETRDEIIEYEKIGKIASDCKANSLSGVIYGSKMIFPLMQTGVYTTATDTNKAVVYMFDLLSKGIEFDNTGKLDNSVTDNVFAEFATPYVVAETNEVYVSGKNQNDTDADIQVILGVYKDDVLIKSKAGALREVKAGKSFGFWEGIDLSDMEDINGVTVKAFIWENSKTIRPLAQVCSPPEVGFNFILDEDASTSAGVYDENDKLIRTLWSAVDYEAGEYTMSWDGKDDYGNYVPDGNYRIEVLSNNVEYRKFVDVIGNTSDCSSWDTFISSYNSITDMAYDKNTNRLYYCSDHVEGGYGLRYLNADNLHTNGALLDESQGNMTAFRVAVDSKRIYWAAEEIQMEDYSGKGYKNFWSFIYATDDGGNPYTFDVGEKQPSKWEETDALKYPSAINRRLTKTDLYNVPEKDNRISGLEVQQEGNFLFSSYMDMNEVYVNDKDTGELLYTHTANMPAGIALEGEDILWIAEQNEDGTYTVKKYSVNRDGSLTFVSSLAHSFDTVLSMAVSPNGELLAVADGGNQDKVYVMSTQTGSVVTWYGSSESYIEDPTIKDDKLMFDDILQNRTGVCEHSFVEFMSDTQLLIGDSGNGRVFKLDLSTETPVIEDKIVFLRCAYSTNAVKNDITRLFSDEIEYSFDYEKAEQYAAGEIPFENAWKMEKNYLLQLAQNYPQLGGSGIASRFDCATKLSNGKIYFRMTHKDGSQYLYMLDGNNIISTGINVTNQDLHEDGSLWYRTYSNNVCHFYKKEITAFDENNIPIYGDEVRLASIEKDKLGITPYNGVAGYSRVPVTDSEKIIMLNAMGPEFSDTEKVRMHLGAIDISEGYSDEWDWMASPSTRRAYSGFFPEDGYFDIGNNVGYTAWNPVTHNNNVIFHYRGEGYSGKQANKFLHFHDNGLLIGVYGRTFTEYGGSYEVGGKITSGSIEELQPSNSMCVSIVPMPDDSDIAYIFQNTEGAAGGIHVSRLSGLDSINVQSSEVTYKKALISGIKYTCYNDAGLDSAYIEKSGVTNTIDIPCIAENNGNHSVRYEGYFKADYTGNFRFAVETDGIVRLWVDSQLLFDGISGSRANYVKLSEGNLYDFKLEISPKNGQLSYLNIGYMNGVKYYPLDMRVMCCEYPKEVDTNNVNLLDGFTYGGSVNPDFYGWTTEIYGGNEDTVLELTTNIWNYRRQDDNDINMRLFIGQNNAEDRNEICVDRSLGEVYSGSYIVDMDMRFTGHLNRGLGKPHTSHGTVIELLDENEKVISNLYFAGGADAEADIVVYGNGEVLMSIPKPVQHLNLESVNKFLDVTINLPQNLKFYTEGDYAVVEYMGERVVTPPVDEDADVYAPAKVRFSKYNYFSGAQYTSNINITRFNLIKE